MKKIVIGTTEIEVTSLNPYAYSGGKGDKVLEIKVPEGNATFEQLKTTLDGNTESIKYYEDDTLICEYVGYGVFEARYKAGVYEVEMHKTTIVEQMNALLNANEQLLKANDTHEKTSAMLLEQNEILAEQNMMLEMTMAEIMEITIPSMIEEIMISAAGHDEMLAALDERLQFVETIVTAGNEPEDEVVEAPVTE